MKPCDMPLTLSRVSRARHTLVQVLKCYQQVPLNLVPRWPCYTRSSLKIPALTSLGRIHRFSTLFNVSPTEQSTLEVKLKNLISASYSQHSMERPIKEDEKDAFNAVLTPELLQLMRLFQQNGYEIRIVGGAVRDILLRKDPPKDVDLSTNASPEQMMSLLSANGIKYIETGLQHGTITVHINEIDFEVTTLRIDIATDGRHATVQFTQDWKLDAQRRDLTINAMSLSIDGIIYDYFNGISDLMMRKVRFVGDAATRIREDYLRILRYFRFYGRIARDIDQHDSNTLKAIQILASGLRGVAVERIWVEVSRILTGNFAPHLLTLMYELGVSQEIGLPAASQTKLQEFTTIWGNMHGRNPQPVTLLVSLTSTPEEAEILMKYWKLSNAERSLGKFISQHRSMDRNLPVKSFQDLIVNASSLKQIEIIQQHVIELLLFIGRHDFAEYIKEWQVPMLPVTGSDLKNIGIKEGPNLGKVLKCVKSSWIESYYTSSKQELLEIAKNNCK